MVEQSMNKVPFCALASRFMRRNKRRELVSRRAACVTTISAFRTATSASAATVSTASALALQASADRS